MSTEIKVYFCPKCRSHNVRYVFGLGNLFGVIPRMECFGCGFAAPSFPILVVDKKKLKKKVVKKSKRVGRKK